MLNLNAMKIYTHKHTGHIYNSTGEVINDLVLVIHVLTGDELYYTEVEFNKLFTN